MPPALATRRNGRTRLLACAHCGVESIAPPAALNVSVAVCQPCVNTHGHQFCWGVLYGYTRASCVDKTSVENAVLARRRAIERLRLWQASTFCALGALVSLWLLWRLS
jgi:hypothetical protein